MAKGNKQSQSTGSHLGFEATLWATADKLRGNLDAAEYKHVVLGLIFLKYISDAFEEKHAELQTVKDANPEDRDEYTAENIFWVPPEARWSYIKGRAKDPLIGKLFDSAMIAIERDNLSLKGVLPKEYGARHAAAQTALQPVARARRRQTRGAPRMTAHLPIPTGLRPSAQGRRVCEATLGHPPNFSPLPQRGCVTRHLLNITGELAEDSVVANFATTAADGKNTA